jgi:hypothetical protein
LKGLLQALNSDINNLRAEIELGPMLGAAIEASYSHNKVLRTQLTTRSRRMAYVHGIISIYGLIEEHIDNLIMEVASIYSQVYTGYDKLPEIVRASHREYSLRALLDGDKARLREPINETTNLNVLTANYNNAPLQLNFAAFTYSTANYRHSHVTQLMHRLDIDVESVVTDQLLKQALSNSGLEFRSIDRLLDDLVDRRNEIAHSYQTVALLETSFLAAYLDVVAAYIRAIYSLASSHVLHVLASEHLSFLGRVVKVWTNRVGVHMESGRVQSPCHVLFVKEKKIFVRAVDSLQSEDIPVVGSLEYEGDIVKLGMSIDSPLQSSLEGAKVFLLPDRWLYLSIES